MCAACLPACTLCHLTCPQLTACTLPAPLAAGPELLRYLSHIHVLHPLPDVLLVDDLHSLTDLPSGGSERPRPRDMALCRILASLHEAAVRRGSSKGCSAMRCSIVRGPAWHRRSWIGVG